MAKRLRLRAHLRHDGAEHHRGANRLQHVFRRDEQGGRRRAPHPLQRGQHFGDHIAAACERAADRVFAPFEAQKPRLRVADLRLIILNVLGGFDQGRREPRAVAAQIFDLRLDLLPLRVRGGDRVFDALQLGFMRRDRILFIA